mmetsp:Transcript_18661/g.17764  ORF Transcript_18661/g.17764 Transcript_18661/m.17764 type:complete len:89 (+) Transcript_18661:133-399(+)
MRLVGLLDQYFLREGVLESALCFHVVLSNAEVVLLPREDLLGVPADTLLLHGRLNAVVHEIGTHHEEVGSQIEEVGVRRGKRVQVVHG